MILNKGYQLISQSLDVIDGINPHESGVIGQIDGDLGIPWAKQGRPIGCIESRCDRLLAEDTKLVKIRTGCMVGLSGQEMCLDLWISLLLFINLEAFDQVLSELIWIQSAVWSFGVLGQSSQCTHSEAERSQNVVLGSPFVVTSETDKGVLWCLWLICVFSSHSERLLSFLCIPLWIITDGGSFDDFTSFGKFSIQNSLSLPLRCLSFLVGLRKSEELVCCCWRFI